MEILFIIYKTSYLNEEVKCTERSPQLGFLAARLGQNQWSIERGKELVKFFKVKKVVSSFWAKKFSFYQGDRSDKLFACIPLSKLDRS
jgi:hypothetical protein